MPAGRYTILDGGNAVGTEDFRCAPGPLGWRYVSEIKTNVPMPHRETVDLAVDSSWRPVRVRVETGSHEVLLAVEGSALGGVRDGQPVETAWGPDVEIDYASPAFNAVTANRLGRTAEFEVVFLEPVTCVPVMARQQYELMGEDEVRTPAGLFRAIRWQFTVIGGSEFTAPFWLAGDVVVAYEGLYELSSYEPGASGPAPLS